MCTFPILQLGEESDRGGGVRQELAKEKRKNKLEINKTAVQLVCSSSSGRPQQSAREYIVA